MVESLDQNVGCLSFLVRLDIFLSLSLIFLNSLASDFRASWAMEITAAENTTYL